MRAVSLLFVFVLLALGQDDGTQLIPAFQQTVERHLIIPEDEQQFYGQLLAKALSDTPRSKAEFVVLVDRDPRVQAALIYWITPENETRFIGASPVSTGKPGAYEHFLTPLGVFEHTIDNPDFRAQGTRNGYGIRGYGAKGLRVYDFGWQSAVRGWGRGGMSKLRLQMHATDPDRLAPRLGTIQSEGCVRIPASLNTFIDQYGILDGDYEVAESEGEKFPQLALNRKPTPWSGRFLVVIDTGRSVRPDWSPAPESASARR